MDAAMTFEELQALFDSREIDITALEEGVLDEASYFGRIFARCGGLAEAVAQGIREQGSTDFELKATSCDGIEQCRIALLKKSKNLLDANFIEGMACTGGCIGGAGWKSPISSPSAGRAPSAPSPAWYPSAFGRNATATTSFRKADSLPSTCPPKRWCVRWTGAA